MLPALFPASDFYFMVTKIFIDKQREFRAYISEDNEPIVSIRKIESYDVILHQDDLGELISVLQAIKKRISRYNREINCGG